MVDEIYSVYLESRRRSIDYVIFESLDDNKRAAFNLLINSLLGFKILKDKVNNADLIAKATVVCNDLVSVFEGLVSTNNKTNHQLPDIIPLVKLYLDGIQISNYVNNIKGDPNNVKLNIYNNPQTLDTLKDDYIQYTQVPSLLNQNFIGKVNKMVDFSSRVHFEHGQLHGKKLEKKDNIDTKNSLYDDEQVTVFLANDILNPKQSVSNCKLYGKGSDLCISGSSATKWYHEYRWDYKLTTYFCFLKTRRHFMLVDAEEGGSFKYNPIWDKSGKQHNVDKNISVESLLKLYPELINPFKANIFKSIPIEGKELEFYNKFHDATSIFEFNALSDRVTYTELKDITTEEWNNIPEIELKSILSTAIKTQESDIPINILDKFPSLKNDYFKTIKARVESELGQWTSEDIIDFTPFELEALKNIQELPEAFVESLDMYTCGFLYERPKYKEKYEELATEFIEKYNVTVENNKWITSGDIYASNATSLSLPQLQTSGNIEAYNATSISLPQLQTSGNIYASKATSISLPQLQTSGDIYASNATSISLPQLQTSGDIYASNATSISLPQLQTSGNIEAYKATSLSLPQLQTSSNIYASKAIVYCLDVIKSKVIAKEIHPPEEFKESFTNFKKFFYI